MLAGCKLYNRWKSWLFFFRKWLSFWNTLLLQREATENMDRLVEKTSQFSLTQKEGKLLLVRRMRLKFFISCQKFCSRRKKTTWNYLPLLSSVVVQIFLHWWDSPNIYFFFYQDEPKDFATPIAAISLIFYFFFQFSQLKDGLFHLHRELLRPHVYFAAKSSKCKPQIHSRPFICVIENDITKVLLTRAHEIAFELIV